MNVSRLLADMALELEETRAPVQMLQKVSDYAVVLVNADDAGVMETRSRQRTATPAATGPRAVEVHQLQTKFDEGPCLDAIEGRATFVTGNTAKDPRWPKWGPAAAALGVHSAVGVRLATRNRGYGSLNVYASRLDAFDERQVQLIEMLAAHTSVAFASSHREEGLSAALDTRALVGQAQGIVMANFGVDSETAFNFLTRISQHENIKLVILAEAIAVQRDSNARP